MQVSFQFTPTKEDYIKSIQAFSATIKSSVVVICVLLVLGIFLGISAFNTPGLETRTDWYIPLIFPALPPLLAVSILFFAPMLNGRRIETQVETNPQLRSPTSWQMDDTQVIIKNEFSETESAWSNFHQAIELDHFYLLVHATNKRVFNFIPKRAFDSAEHEAAFRLLVEQKLGKLQNDTHQKRVILPLLNYVGVLLLLATTIAFWIPLLSQIMKYR